MSAVSAVSAGLRPTVWNGPSSPDPTPTTSSDSGTDWTSITPPTPSALPGAVPSASGYPAAGVPIPSEPPQGAKLATTDHPWSWDWGGAAVLLSGGPMAVDTDDLRTFASSLASSADQLDDARVNAEAALWEARCAIGPSEPDTTEVDPGDTSMMCVPVGRRVGTSFDIAQDSAITALTNLSTGTGSLDDIATRLRDLAADVTACADVYDQAEDGADASLGPYQSLWLTTLPGAMGPSTGAGFLAAVGSVVIPDDFGGDVAQSLSVLLTDPGMSVWVRRDLLVLAGLVAWSAKAETGRESATMEVYLARTAERLDPWVTSQLPDEVQVGTQMVATSTLTSMQRVAYYLALKSESSGTKLYGREEGVTVTQRTPPGYPTVSTTVPPGYRDPLGLGTAVQTGSAVSLGIMTVPPRTAAATIRYSDDLQHHHRPPGEDHDETGTIAVLRTTHEDGSRSWLVIVPGTTDWGSGDHETQDLLTNFQGVAGRPTDMESAVVTAMRQAGIGEDEPVGLYGHSQGAITVTNIAADPAMTERYHITNVLTAGGPTAGVELPDSVSALHLENSADAVPALDATANPTGPNRITATVDTRDLPVSGYPHGAEVYAEAAEGLEEKEPALKDWFQSYAALTGGGEEGATTEKYVFDIKRDLAGDGVGLGEAEPSDSPDGGILASSPAWRQSVQESAGGGDGDSGGMSGSSGTF